MIDFSHFTYFFPQAERPAVDDLTLQVGAGEFVLLTGPSGAGKSTLLRALGGLVPHFSGGRVAGRVRVAGRDPVSAGPAALSRSVGYVFQDPEAQAVLDRVEAEVAFSLENAAVPPDEMRERVQEALAWVDLLPLRDRRLATLSGGQRQRAAIATALALRPQILALDEPTSQLDPEGAREVLETLARLNEERGLTILLAEHRLERVLPYAGRVIALEAGRVVADGPVPRVLEELPRLPPLAALGRALGWRPLPRTVAEARPFLAQNGRPAPESGRWLRPRTAQAGDNGGRNGASGVTGAREEGAPLLEARDVRFAYDGRPALRGADITVRPGEVVALLGRNGSGKTTLLKCMVGLLQPETGDVAVAGRSIRNRDVADICRDVAYLPQSPGDLLYAQSVREELASTLANHGVDGGSERIDALLAKLGLAHAAEAYPRDLSVGQRQRVALGAVTVTQPPLVLLDEPTRGLDYETKEALVALWLAWRQAGMGLILATHDVELAAQVADRALVLHRGEVVAEGSPAGVFAACPAFAPQVARLFPGRGWLTVEDAVEGLRSTDDGQRAALATDVQMAEEAAG